MKKFLIISMVALGLFSCKEDKKESGNDGISVESITCSEHEVSIFRGYTTAVNVTVLPEDAEDKSFSWTVADETIAKFKDDNTILGVNVGETWAYAISNDKPEIKDSIKITVNAMELKSIPVTDENIHYEGRIVKGSSDVQYLYPGTSFSINFTGSSLYADFSKVVCYYWVEVDNNEPYKLYTRSKKNWVADNTFRIAEGLEDGEHTAKITLCSEGVFKNPKFYGFKVDESAEVSKPKAKTRKFEFIGNSITCGYGTEVTNRAAFNDSTSNFCHTFAYATAQEFDAEIMVVARSGIGIYRNYNYEDPGYGTMLDTYEKTWLKSPNNWDFSSYTPDVVFINLGTNDTFDMSTFSSDDFESAFRSLLDKVTTYYPNSKIVLLTGSMMNDEKNALSTVKSILDKLQADYNTNEHPCYRFDFKTVAGTGADWHPCAAQQAQMGQDLISFLKENVIQ